MAVLGHLPQMAGLQFAAWNGDTFTFDHENESMRNGEWDLGSSGCLDIELLNNTAKMSLKLSFTHMIFLDYISISE